MMLRRTPVCFKAAALLLELSCSVFIPFLLTSVSAQDEAADLAHGKGFQDAQQVPREPMVFICSDCHPCLYPDTTTYHVETAHDCEQACYFSSSCRYTAYNPREQECNQYTTCKVDKTGDLEYTRMHKRDPGVLSDLYLSSSCSLEPAFQPMVQNYKAGCPSTAVGAATFKSKNDLWVNDEQIFRSSKGYATVPAELYHDTPTVLSIQTLMDIEMTEDDVVSCSEHHHCQAGFWNPNQKCAGGFCRTIAHTYTVAFQDTSVADYDQATTDRSYGALSRETIMIKPPDAADVIADYAQVMQDYAGTDYEKEVLATVHNNKPLQPVCQHCNKICDYGSDYEWFLRSEGALPRFQCIESCYKDRKCVAVNINEEEGICDLFKTCHEKDMLMLSHTDAGELLKMEKHPVSGEHKVMIGGVEVKKRSLEGKEEDEEEKGKKPSSKEDAQEHQQEKDDKDDDDKKKESDKPKILPGQKIKNPETGKTEVLKVPEEFKISPGVLTQFMVFRRPELNSPHYVAPDKHLLDFGGTEYGTVDLVG
ncbi:unnamed protein product, partial [Amoebophrya sp. A120]|eukprot:GSA120T00017169001.1